MKIKIGIIVGIFCALFSVSAHAQTLYSWQDTIQNTLGQANPSATIIVLSGTTSGAAQVNTTTQPGTPLATIYADPYGATPINQTTAPLTTAAGNGWFQFWAAPGYYVIQAFGPGINGQEVYGISIGGSSSGGSVNPGPVGDLGSYQTPTIIGDSGIPQTGVALTTLNNIFLENQTFAGPNPYYDITAYGGRAVSSIPTSTGNCSATTSFQLTGGVSTFKNGDGVVIPNCGVTETMTGPGAPTITPGISVTFTVPDAHMVETTGSSTYHYAVVGLDQYGGITAPGATATITNGLVSLGMTALSVTSASLTGNTLTLTLPATNALAQYDLIHYWNATDKASLSGWGTISSVSAGGETIVIDNYSVSTNSSTPVTSTAGSISYAAGNQITWTPNSSVFKYAVCGARPADGATLHFLGYVFPYGSTDYPSHYPSSSIFTDWGATMTKAPPGPWELASADSMCTGSAVNDYLATTIVSGAGTSTLTLANSASQTATGNAINFTNGPALRAAAAAANATRGMVLIPVPPSDSDAYEFYDFTDLYAYRSNVSLEFEGNLGIYDTLIPPNKFFGGDTVGSEIQFQMTSTPTAYCLGAWPCLYAPFASPDWYNFTAEGYNNTNQSLIILWDAGMQGGSMRDVNISSAANTNTNDYCGFGLVIRPGIYSFNIDGANFFGGPGNSSSLIDKTWCPEVYYGRDPNAVNGLYSIVDWHHTSWQFTGRTFYQLDNAGTQQQDSWAGLYTQGGILPLLTLQGDSGVQDVNLVANNFTNDTSPSSDITLLGAGGINIVGNLIIQNMEGLSIESGSSTVPPFLSGIPANSLFLLNAAAAPTNLVYVNDQPTLTIAAGTAALGTSSISSGACASAVTVSASGVATTDNIQTTFNADPTSTTGYEPSSSGMLAIIPYPTSGNVNFKVCNNTASSITPGAVTLNWRVVR